ncbi:MAG TPA: tagatose-bisphosphate aldolase [Clostridiales bacterium]|nr:tagatose-bisphosphate aldolase [Clostridiales bacterium]
MPLVNTKEMLGRAQAEHFAVGAFNIENMEMAQAVVAAAEEAHAPVIIQTTPGTVRYGSLELYYANVAALAERAAVPVALHLDHGESFDMCARALCAGYTSIMIDGSREDFESNIALTEKVAAFARPNSVSVEAELGKVGGKEDDMEGGGGYTVPAEAAEFAARTGIDSLAVAIGTAHGVYTGVPVLHMECLREIKKLVSLPLVLHGASGLSDEQVRACIAAGICKVNFATELRCAFTDGIKETLAKTPDAYDPKPLGKAGRQKVFELVANRIKVCGADGKA